MYMYICTYVYVYMQIFTATIIQKKRNRKSSKLVINHIDGRLSVQYLAVFWEFKLATINDYTSLQFPF